MNRFEIQPVLGSALPDVARFLCRSHVNDQDGSFVLRHPTEESACIEQRLRWLLLDNPVETDGCATHGYCIRDHLGIIRGLSLSFPAAFLAADQRLIGLCSGSLFIESQARTLGYYLVRKKLGSPGHAFFFATTCNANSGPLWRMLGGCAVPNSETNYILPLRLDAMLPTLVSTKTSSRVASGIARILGRCANPMLQLCSRQSAKLTTEPSQDWPKLSELFRRHRPADWITSDRSAEFLQWRFGQTSPDSPCRLYLFRDKRGNEGWFCLGDRICGRNGQFRASVLLDAIWPREKMGFKDILPAILSSVAAQADAIYFRPRPGLDYSECRPWIVPRRSEAPQAFVITPKGRPPIATRSLDYADCIIPYSDWMAQASRAGARSTLSTDRAVPELHGARLP